VTTNGFISFLDTFPVFFNESIPNPNEPNAAVYPYWDDLIVDGEASVSTELVDDPSGQRFVIEWRNVTYFDDDTRRVDFEIILEENGHMLAQYRNIADDARERGSSATLGIEDQDGAVALQFSSNKASIGSPEYAILYQLPPSGFIEGHVTDANDGLPISGATVRALQDGTEIRSETTDADGFYRFQAPLGTYTVEASKTNYSTETAEVVLDEEDEVVTQDFVLDTALAEVSPDSLVFIQPPDEVESQTLTLSNAGTLDLEWEVTELGGGPLSGGAAVGHASGTGTWLYQDKTGVKVAVNGGGTALAHPAAFKWEPTGAAPTQASILVYADDAYHFAPNTYLDQALQRLGLPYTAHYDADFAGFEDSLASQDWDIVLFGDDNFFPETSTLDALADYAAGGGKLAYNSWTVGADPGHPVFDELGFDWIDDDTDPPDPVYQWEPAHPVFSDPESVPEFTDLEGGRYGVYGQRGDPLAGFTALAGYTTPGPDPAEAALILGDDGTTVFKGFMDGQNDADLDSDGVPDGVELWENIVVGLESGFATDVPWLTEDPTSGTIAPGEDQEIQVTADSTGLAPGAYGATLVFHTNSGRISTLRVPVTLIVPAYLQGVNAGGDEYTDVDGEVWAADQEFSAGSWGHLGTSHVAQTTRPIDGTDDDPLYQDSREGEYEYRFDSVPNGVYMIELRFAEWRFRAAGMRLFDVTVEDDVVLFRHDVFAEVGRLAADDHVFFVEVTDGQLNVNLWKRGAHQPFVSALRVTHRPDM
jgi:hypothetical protein